MDAALNYREPDIVSILILSSFLLVLNVGDHIVNSYLSCGLVAQILVGWGTSGAKLLNHDAENFITLLGYLGLIFLVFEGEYSMAKIWCSPSMQAAFPRMFKHYGRISFSHV